MKNGYAGAALLAVMSLAACGRGEETKGQPSAEERRALDNIAAKQDAEADRDVRHLRRTAWCPPRGRGRRQRANAANAANAAIRMGAIRTLCSPTTRTPPLPKNKPARSALRLFARNSLRPIGPKWLFLFSESGERNDWGALIDCGRSAVRDWLCSPRPVS
jgi:hypothetical protein